MDLVVDRVLLRPGGEQIHRRKLFVAQTKIALRRSRDLCRSRNRDFRWSDGLQAVVRRAKARRYTILVPVQRKHILLLLLRQRLGRLAKVGLGHLANLKTSRAFHFTHERPRVLEHRLFVGFDEAQSVLANDRLFHFFFAAAFGQPRPLQ